MSAPGDGSLRLAAPAPAPGPTPGQLRHEAFMTQHTEAAERGQSHPWVKITAAPTGAPKLRNQARSLRCREQQLTKQLMQSPCLLPSDDNPLNSGYIFQNRQARYFPIMTSFSAKVLQPRSSLAKMDPGCCGWCGSLPSRSAWPQLNESQPSPDSHDSGNSGGRGG